MDFRHIRGVVMDMDGVLWRGNEPLPGLAELFAWLAETRMPYVLASNNSGTTPADYVAKLARMGVDDVPESSIVTSGTATAAYLQARYRPGTRVHVLGMDGLRQTLDEAGYDVYDQSDDEPVEVVVVGIDFALTYDKLKQAALYIRSGAEFVGTNPDRTFPMPQGLVPGTGSLIAALEAATDRQPVVIGKPGRPMFQAALDVLDSPPAQTVMIGDRLDTDIMGAQEAGLRTILLFSGVTTADELARAEMWPDVAYDGLPELLKAWAGEEWYRQQSKARR
jgi:4-nitrophenyl phosphatase